MRRAILLALLFVAGCNTGPTDPDRTIALMGTIEKDKPVVEAVVMRNTGNMRITLVKSDFTAADGTVTAGPRVLVQLGTGNATTCTATGVFGFDPGSVVSLGLEKGGYCLRMSEVGTLAEGAKITYDLSVEITD